MNNKPFCHAMHSLCHAYTQRDMILLLHDAMLARYVVVVCLSVRPSVTRRYCIKTAKHSITQITSHHSPGTQFSVAKNLGEISKGSPPTGAPNRDEVGSHRRLGRQVDRSKCKPTDGKPSLKEVWSRHVSHFKFLWTHTISLEQLKVRSSNLQRQAVPNPSITRGSAIAERPARRATLQYQLKCWPTVVGITQTDRVSLRSTFSNCHF